MVGGWFGGYLEVDLEVSWRLVGGWLEVGLKVSWRLVGGWVEVGGGW